MPHFAIPDGEFSPTEAELASILDCEAALTDGFVPLGLVLVTSELRFSIVLLALTNGIDVDRWWAR
jgi:hypothetical protein